MNKASYEGYMVYQNLKAKNISSIRYAETTRIIYYALISGEVVAFSKKTGRKKLLKKIINQKGVEQVKINRRSVSVSTIMARAFLIPNSETKPIKIYHLDGNSNNNNLRNLSASIDV